MSSTLFLAVSSTTIQSVLFSEGDYLVYEADTQVATPYMDGDTLNPPPFHLPEAALNFLVSRGTLCPIPDRD